MNYKSQKIELEALRAGACKTSEERQTRILLCIADSLHEISYYIRAINTTYDWRSRTNATSDRKA